MSMRTLVVAVGVLVVIGSAATGQMQAERVATGLDSPLYAVSPPGDTDRLFILEQNTGLVKILNLGTGTVNPTPFLTIPAADLEAGGFEQGLLGLAFHPEYGTNGRVFVNYTAPGGGAAGQTKVVEYTADAGNPDVVDPVSERTIATLNQPFANHNGGWLGFGPDNHLYWSTGDGGSAYDPNDNAQTISGTLLGKMLRIDVDGDDFGGDPNRNYAIPMTNPFVGATGEDEIWAYGLRNPWRASFDRATGDLWIGDVGQSAREEIDFQPAASVGGENYGWRLREGSIETPSGVGGPRPSDNVDPIHDYDHPPGGAVTGGYVYRGPADELDGLYFFGDYGTGQVWVLRYDGSTVSDFQEVTGLLAPDAGSIDQVASFGEDAAGNLYIVDLDGDVFRVVPEPATMGLLGAGLGLLAVARRRGPRRRTPA